MDLGLFARVVWRFKVVVLLGLSLALVLALLSYVRVDISNGFKMNYREAEQWESLSTLFVTDPDFTLGSTAADPEAAAAIEARMLSLTALYMQLATSDDVLRMASPIDGAVQTFPITSTGDSRGDPLPMMTFSAVAITPQRAHRLATRHINAFLNYLKRDQDRRNVAPADRVQVEVVRQPRSASLLVPRKRTRPIIVFLAVAMAAFGAAFVLENLRPRVRAVSDEGRRTDRHRHSRRRSA